MKKTVTERQVKSFADSIIKYIFQSRRLGKSYTQEHRHSFYEMILVLSGGCLHKVNDYDFTMHEGDFIILAPGDSHRLAKGEDECEVLCISVSREEFAKYEALFGNFARQSAPIRLSEETLGAIRALLTEESHSESATVAVCSLLLAGSRDSLKNSGNGIPSPLRIMVEKLGGDISLQREGVAAMLRLSCYSPAQLTRLMRRHYAVSPHEFIKKLRLSTARELTLRTDISLEAISDDCGYKCYGYFTDVFKKRYGVTPAVMRKQRG